MDWMPVLLHSLLIFCLRVTDVSLGTMRLVMIARGMRYRAAAIGFVEVIIWVVAVSKVIGQLDNPIYIIAYGLGFAAGTLVGMGLVDRLSLGFIQVRVISMTCGRELSLKVRQAGHGATLIQAEGHAGNVHWVDIVARRRHLTALLELIRNVDSKAFVTVEDASHVIGGYPPSSA